MVGSASEVVVEFVGRDTSLSRVSDGAVRTTSRLGDKLKNLGKIAALGLAAGVAVGAKALFDMTKNAADDEAAQRRLATAMRNSVGATDEQIGKVEDWIASVGRATGITDDEMRPAFQRLVQATGDVGEAQRQMRIAMDVSAGTGKSLKVVTEALMKANNGTTSSLSRLGLKTIDAQGNALSLDEALAKMSKTFKGQAEANANSLQGKMARLNLVWDEMKETIGAKLIPVVERLATWFLDKGLPAVEKFGGYLGRTLPPIFENIRSVVSSVMGAFSGDVGSGFGDLSGLVEGARKNFATLTAAIKPTFNDIVSIVRDAVSIVKSLWALFGDNIVQYATTAFEAIVQIIRGAFTIVRGIFKTVSALLKGDWSGVWDGIKMILRGAWQVITGILKAGFNIIRFGFKNTGVIVRAIFAKLWDGIKALARAGIGWVIGQFRAIPGRVRAILGLLVDVSRAIWGKVWDLAKTLVRNGISWVAGAIRALPGKIRSMIGFYVDVMRSLWGKVWDIARTLVANGITWVFDKIRELPGKIRGLAGSMLDAGKALIGKFFDGLKALGSLGAGVAKDLMGGIVRPINTAISAINTAIPNSIGIGKLKINLPDNPFPTIPGYATGTPRAPRGLAIVGERGPELVEFDGGERVYTAGQTRRLVRGMTAGGSGDGGTTIILAPQFNNIVTDPVAVVRELEKLARAASFQLNRPVLGTSGR